MQGELAVQWAEGCELPCCPSLQEIPFFISVAVVIGLSENATAAKTAAAANSNFSLLDREPARLVRLLLKALSPFGRSPCEQLGEQKFDLRKGLLQH